MRIDLLEKMVGVLSTMAPFDVEPDGTITRVFDMEVWLSESLEDGAGAYFFGLKSEKFCGFSGCAIGTCYKAGVFEGTDLIMARGFPETFSNQKLTYEVLGHVLGITDQDAIYLFDPDNYNNIELYDPKAVAKRIQDYIEEHRYDG